MIWNDTVRQLDNDITHVTHQHLNSAGCLNHWVVWCNFSDYVTTSHISQDTLYVPVTPGLVEHITNTTPSLHFPRAWERITPQTTMAAVVHAGLDQGHRSLHKFTHKWIKLVLCHFGWGYLVASDIGRIDQRLFRILSTTSRTHLVFIRY